MRLFLVGGGGNLDDLIVSGVDGAGDAPDAAALAGGIPAFEDQDAGEFLLTGRSDQFAQPGLLIRQCLVVVFLVQAQGQIQRVQQALLGNVDGGLDLRPGFRAMIGSVFDVPGDSVQDMLAYGQAAVTDIAAVDDQPGRFAGAGLLDDLFRDSDEFIVQFQVFFVLVGDAPARFRIFFQGFQAFFLGTSI